MSFKVVKNKLSLKESIDFIEMIVSSYFIEDEDGNLTYEPYSGILGEKTAFLKHYTDYQFSDDTDEDFDFICVLNIDDYVKPVNKNMYVQYHDLMKAVNRKVASRRQKLIKEQTDGIYQLLITLSNKIKEFKIPDLNVNDINAFIKKFNSSDLSSDSVVKAFLNSDYHKNHEAELLDTKNEIIKQMESGMEERIMKRLAESRNVINMLDTTVSNKTSTKAKTTTRKKKTEKVE